MSPHSRVKSCCFPVRPSINYKARRYRSPSTSLSAPISYDWKNLSISREICGTANPIKEIGPQKAVVVAVNIPVHKRMAIRARLIRIPRLAAYISPSNKAFRGFISKTANSNPINAQVPKKGNCSKDTPEKLPSPHITKACTRSVEE